MYGLFLWVIAAAYLQRAARVRLKYLAWGSVATIFVLVLLAPRHYAGMTLLLALAAFAAYVAFDPVRSQPYRFVWLLVTAGLGAIAVGEVVYLRDFFDGVLLPLQHGVQVRLPRVVPPRPRRNLHRLLEPGMDGAADPRPL